MTRLTYKIGNENATTYSEAQKLAEKTNLPIVPIYTDIPHVPKVKPGTLEKIQLHFMLKAVRA